MSRRLQDMFWDCDLTSTEQLVAQRLAWHANDEDGRCWPGIRSLATKTGLSERAVQKAAKALEDKKHITREERIGLGMVYTVHPRTSCTGTTGQHGSTAQADNPKALTPERRAPVAAKPEREGAKSTPEPDAPRTTFTPEPRSPDPRTSCTQTVQEPVNTDDGEARATRKRAPSVKRGNRMVVEWQPTLSLPPSLQSAVDAWPPGRLQHILDEFRDYWLGESGQRAAKQDWDRTFHNRIRSVIDRDNERSHRRYGKRTDDQPTGGEPRSPLAAAAADYLAGRQGGGQEPVGR